MNQTLRVLYRLVPTRVHLDEFVRDNLINITKWWDCTLPLFDTIQKHTGTYVHLEQTTPREPDTTDLDLRVH